MSAPKKIFVIAGEVSGDSHLASLLRELFTLNPAIEVRGLAGPETAEIVAQHGAPGSTIEDWTEEAAVVGLSEVLKHYNWFKKKFDAAIDQVRDWQPDIVLPVDYPGFNLRFAKAIRQQSVPTKICYYISPQVWAWNRRRIPEMARVLDRMLCIFPFEEPLYEESGLATTFVGHPLVDDLAPRRANPPERNPHQIALLPGSRQREIQRHLPLMLKSAKQLNDQQPKNQAPLQFIASARTKRNAQLMHEIAAKYPEVEIEIATGNARDLMQQSQVGIVASGTATLEAACLGLPYCLVYQVTWPTYLIGRMLVKVDYLGMVNVLAHREVVKEFIQADAQPDAIAAELNRLLERPDQRQELQAELADITSRLGAGGAARRAATELAKML